MSSTTIIPGIIAAVVATKLPGIPATLKPVYVAMLMPIGPGVDSATANMSAIC